MRTNLFTLLLVKKMRRLAIRQAQSMPVFGETVQIPVRWGKLNGLLYRPARPDPNSPVFFDLHGGGFILGDARMDDLFCDRLRNALNITVISLNYRLAPEYPYPCAVEDVTDAVQSVAERAADWGIDEQRMAIGGHSAGGNLATVACMQALKHNRYSLRCQILDYPPLDLKTSPYDKPNPKGAIPPKLAAAFDRCYRLPREADHPDVSPLYAPQNLLTGLPPALMITAGFDSLNNEGKQYADRLRAAQVDVTERDFPGAVHGFSMDPNAAGWVEAQDLMIEFLRNHLL